MRVAKVPVMESVEKLETGKPLKSWRQLGDTDHRDRLVEVQLWNANVHRVDRKGTRIGAAELDVPHQGAATAEAVVFVKEQLPDRLLIASAGVGQQVTHERLSSTAQR